MKRSALFILTLCAILFVSAAGASADTLLSYTVTGPITATFELPVNPTPFQVDPGFGFAVTPINLMINGVASNDFMDFFSDSAGNFGGFAAFACSMCTPDINVTGQQFYSGSEDAPTMLIVTNSPLLDFNTGADRGTVTSVPVSSVPTPEPSSSSLLAIGLAAVMLTAAAAKGSLPR